MITYIYFILHLLHQIRTNTFVEQRSQIMFILSKSYNSSVKCNWKMNKMCVMILVSYDPTNIYFLLGYIRMEGFGFGERISNGSKLE